MKVRASLPANTHQGLAETGRITSLVYTVSSRAVSPPGGDYLRRGDETAGETEKKRPQGRTEETGRGEERRGEGKTREKGRKEERALLFYMD